MPQEQKLSSKWLELREIKGWIAGKLREEQDRQVRDALFAASYAISLAMLKLEKVEYETSGDYDQEDR